MWIIPLRWVPYLLLFLALDAAGQAAIGTWGILPAAILAGAVWFYFARRSRARKVLAFHAQQEQQWRLESDLAELAHRRRAEASETSAAVQS